MEFISSLSEWGYVGLFISAFLAGSLLPLSSEAVLGILLVADFNPYICLFTATAGNWLGGVTCFYIGYLGKMEWIEKYLRIKPEKLKKMQQRLQKEGSLIAFFTFLPGIGDLIIVGLGLMRANVLIVNISMFAGKFLRYYLLTEGIHFFSSLL
ncbi:MAG: DedA family protein [Coprobacter sp.]|nr:DedA family protein [Coprobacter sp.]